MASASLDANGKGLYEPIHGSAPDIAGQGKANPLATVLSAAMMLRYSLGLSDAADRIETAVAQALAKGARSHDLGGTMSTRQRSEEHTSELQSLMRNSYAVFCLKKKKLTAINAESYATTDIK